MASETAAHSGNGWEALRRLLNSSEPDDSTECNWNWRSPRLPIWRAIKNRGREYNGYPVSAGYFGAYSLDGLAMALHCVYSTTSFDAALVKCVNFNGDADSTGSMVGQGRHWRRHMPVGVGHTLLSVMVYNKEQPMINEPRQEIAINIGDCSF